MTTKMRTRFAPSPTGKLHVGNVRTAIIVWLSARAMGGEFMFRLDDTDMERSKEEYAESIQRDLKWLGMDWDLSARQKERQDRYQVLIQKLKDDGRLYPCYETPEELSLKRKSLLSRGLPPIYDRAALNLTDEQKSEYEAEGRQPHWRFLLKHEPIEWDDLIRGPVKFEGKDLADPVLIREDGSPLYHICSVIDDVDFEITHVVRGEDHVSNTAAHVQMFEALGASSPVYAHLPLISDAEGGKLSKRIGSLGIEELRDVEKLDPMAIMSYLSRLGTSLPIEPVQDMKELIDTFDFKNFSRSTPKFDVEELFRLNAKILHETSYENVKSKLGDMGLSDLDESFWNAVRANLGKLDDIQDWWKVANGPITPEIEDEGFAAEAASLLPAEPWTQETFGTWINEVKEKTGRKGKQLFMPIRKALTGMEHGPEMDKLLPLIGEVEAKARLSGYKKAA
jgi:glutamyl-tRNA synthetase